MPPAGFEPTISAGERPQTYALERAATGTDYKLIILLCYVLRCLYKSNYKLAVMCWSPAEMWRHTVTQGRVKEGETGEWSG